MPACRLTVHGKLVKINKGFITAGDWDVLPASSLSPSYYNYYWVADETRFIIKK